MARRCPTCRHEPYTLTGRCVVPLNADTICGCTCAAQQGRARTEPTAILRGGTNAYPDAGADLIYPAA